MVVAQTITSREEGLTGILCPQESELQAGAVVEFIADGMLVGIAQIAVVVTLTTVERYTERGRHVMGASAKHAVQTWEGWLLGLVA